LVFYELITIANIKIKKEILMNLARLKDSLFGYLILRHINGYNKEIEKLYLE
jgi:hypothetical protein